MKITKGKYTLTHDTYMNMGILCDRIQIKHNKTIYPIVPPPVVRDYDPKKNMLDSTMGYTESELTEILEDFIQKLGNKGKDKSFFKLDISLQNPKIPEEQMEAFLLASEMNRIFQIYNIDHSKLCFFPEGVEDGEIVTGKISGINVAYPRAK